MNDATSGQETERATAEHGAPSEMTWDGGQGRQPYQNRESGPDGAAAAAAHEAVEGDRGAASGRNLEQFEQIRRMP